jgi:transcriptional regulator with XRE-family HTH domain
MLRDQQHRLEVAGRIRQLRLERVPRPKVRELADLLGYSDPRGYSKAEATGGISWDKLEKLADFYGVETHWLLNGEDRPETPDLTAALNGDASAIKAQLDRIEQGQQEIRTMLAGLATQIATSATTAESAPETSATSEAPSGGTGPRSRRRAA